VGRKAGRFYGGKPSSIRATRYKFPRKVTPMFLRVFEYSSLALGGRGRAIRAIRTII